MTDVHIGNELESSDLMGRPAVPRGLLAFNILRMMLGSVLLLAAGMKAHQFATGPVPSDGLLTSRAAIVTIVEMEILLGIWMLSLRAPRAAWCVALVCFIIFGAYSLWRAIGGHESCGCFGRARISPWWTASFDFAAVMGLAIFRPAPERNALETDRQGMRAAISWSALIVVALTTTIAAAMWMRRGEGVRLSPDAAEFPAGQIVLIEPQEWVGRRLPLLSHIDVGSRLSKGRWLVLLYHHDCPKCVESIPTYERLARERSASFDPDAERVALIEMPPYAEVGHSPVTDRTVLHGQLSADREWFAQTPSSMRLRDGVVLDSTEQAHSEAF